MGFALQLKIREKVHRDASMSQATNFWDSNLAAALAGGLIGFFAAAITLIWTTYHDRYKRALDEHERLAALLVEIDYIDFCSMMSLSHSGTYRFAVTRTLSTSDPVPTLRRAKSDFLSVSNP